MSQLKSFKEGVAHKQIISCPSSCLCSHHSSRIGDDVITMTQVCASRGASRATASSKMGPGSCCRRHHHQQQQRRSVQPDRKAATNKSLWTFCIITDHGAGQHQCPLKGPPPKKRCRDKHPATTKGSQAMLSADRSVVAVRCLHPNQSGVHRVHVCGRDTNSRLHNTHGFADTTPHSHCEGAPNNTIHGMSHALTAASSGPLPRISAKTSTTSLRAAQSLSGETTCPPACTEVT